MKILGIVLIVISIVAIIIISLVSYNIAGNNTTKLTVITSVAPIKDIISNVGCDRITLIGLVPEGVDSHTFELRPLDAAMMRDADLVIINGLNLEVSFERVVESIRQDNPNIRLLKLGDNTITPQEWIFDFSFPKEDGNPNPHLWLNVAYTIRYVELIRDELIMLDPSNREHYIKNSESYIARLEELDKGITASIESIPIQHRKLLTYHDSWAYFAKRYGMDVIGALQPSDFGEPTPQDIAKIIEQIRQEDVPAIFASEVFPSKVMEEIAREADVDVVETLADDILPGSKDDPNHTYIGMMIENMRNMVIPLGGSIDALDDIDARSICNG